MVSFYCFQPLDVESRCTIVNLDLQMREIDGFDS